MTESTTSRRNDRLSVSTHTTTPPRPISPEEMAVFKAVADCLIPAVDGNRGGSDLEDFSGLITRASALSGHKFHNLMKVAASLSSVSSNEQLWETLKQMSISQPQDFYVLSTTVVAAYLYSAEMQETLNYPRPHRNPASMFDVAEELSSGILDPVCERGRTYVDLDTPAKA